MNRKIPKIIKKILGHGYVYQTIRKIGLFIRPHKCYDNPIKQAEYNYKLILGKVLNLESPVDLNEKINWMKFYSDTTKWTLLADKYKVRKYIEDCGLSRILVKLYGKWDRADQIDFSKLQYPCILKVNHGCGGNFILKQIPSTLKQHIIIKKINKLLETPYGKESAEPHYLNIKRCVIAEEFLVEKKEKISSTLVDYKVWCLGGHIYCIFVCFNRTPLHIDIAAYDSQWNYHPEWCVFSEHCRNGGNLVSKPKLLNQMLEIALLLSKNMPQARIDFYIANDKIYFGEITMTSQGGYMDYFTPKVLLEMGHLCKLPIDKT